MSTAPDGQPNPQHPGFQAPVGNSWPTTQSAPGWPQQAPQATPQDWSQQPQTSQPAWAQQPQTTPQGWAQQPQATQPGWSQQTPGPSDQPTAPPTWTAGGPGTPAAGYPTPGVPVPAPAPTGPENVGKGLFFSLGSIVIGVVLTIALIQVGFVASITAWAAAAAAVWLYTKGAGSAPRKGIAPLLGVVLFGVAVQFFALIGSSLWRAYRGKGGTSGQLQFVFGNLFNPDVIGDYLVNGVMFLVFAGLGIFGILRGLTVR